MCKNGGNVSDAAAQFADLFSVAALQPVLQTQTRSKKSDAQDRAKQFQQLKDLFIGEMMHILLAISDDWSDYSKKDLTSFFKESPVESEDPLKKDIGKNYYKNLFYKLKPKDQIKYVDYVHLSLSIVHVSQIMQSCFLKVLHNTERVTVFLFIKSNLIFICLVVLPNFLNFALITLR